MTTRDVDVLTAAISDPEALTTILRSAKIELWQLDVATSPLAAIDDDIHPDDRARIREALLACTAGGPDCAVEYRVVAADGTTRDFEAHGRLIRDPSGAPSKIAGIRRDKTAERAALRYATLSRMIPAHVWTATADGTVDFINDNGLQFLGRAAFTGDATWHDAVHRSDFDSVMQRWRQSVAAGEPFEASMRLRRADGEYRWFIARAIPIRDASGSIIQWLGTMTDVDEWKTMLAGRTAQIEIEQLLVRARKADDVIVPILERYCRNLGWTCAQLWRVNQSTGLLWRMAGWCDATIEAFEFGTLGDLAGDFPERIRQSRAPASIPDLEIEPTLPRVEALRRLGLRSAFGFPVIVRGEVTAVLELFSIDKRTVNQTAIEMNAAIGSQVGNFIERMEAEQELSDALHRLKRLQNVTDAALSHLSLDELLDDLLPKICDAMTVDFAAVFLADHERQELYSVSTLARNGLVPWPHLRVRFGESFAGRIAVDRHPLTLRHVTSDPTVTPQARALGAETAAGVPLQSGQRLVGVLVIGSRADKEFERDELNLLELVGQRLTNAIVNSSLYESARESNRVKDRFLSVASHELRAPITGILGWISILRIETDPEIRAEALDWIEKGAKTQAQLVADLLDATRIREGKLVLHSQSVDVRDVVQSAIRIVEAQARDRGVILEASLPERAVPIVGDPTRLQQVVWNLLGNAVKFTPAGKRVRAIVDAIGSSAKITVADEGDGIQPEFLPHVFNAFEQDANGKRAGGLGLGLHIVSTIVSMHGGTIEAMSDGPGRGATFTVSLPVASTAAA